MRTCSLQSGSNGNSIFVEADGVRLLFDAGISGRQAELRMQHHGFDIRDVDALLISHNHSDHIRSAGIFQRKFGIPIVITEPAFQTVRCKLGRLSDVRFFTSGTVLEYGDVRVSTIKTPHDATDGVAFVVEAEQKRLGILTDLGHPFRELKDVLATVDAAYLESNYDPAMLERGSYPEDLKARIRSSKGHLSNAESAELVAGLNGHTLQWLALAHLSQENNTSALALATHKAAYGERLPLHIASRYGVSELLEV